MSVDVQRLVNETAWSPISEDVSPEKLLRQVLDWYIRAEANLSPYHDRWVRFYQLYRAQMPPKRRIWRANICVPIPFAEVETGLADFMAYWFEKRPIAPLTPREPDDYDAARVMEAYLEWESDDIPLWLPMYETGKEMLMYGTGWQKITWDWVRDRNNVEHLSVWQVYPDLSADNVDDAQYIIERRLRPLHWVRRMAALGVYAIEADELEKMAQDGLAFQTRGDELVGLAGLSQDIYRGVIEVMECWTADGWVATVLNRRKLVRAHRNPFPHGRKPYVRWVDNHVPGEMMGIGEIEIIEALVNELNDVRNQRMDTVTLMLNNVLVASRTAGIDPEDLVLRPGAIIWSNDPNAVRPLIQQAPVNVGISEEQQIRFDIQQTTGNWGYNQGQTPLRRETATTVLALQRAASKRYALKLRMNEEVAFRPAVHMRIANAQSFLPQERWIRVTGQDPKPVQVRRDDIQGTFDYITSVSPPEPKEAKRAALQQILPLLISHPRINDREFLDWVLELYNLHRDRSKLLLSDEEMMQKMSMMQSQRQARSPQGTASPDLLSPKVRTQPPNLEELQQARFPAIQEILEALQQAEVTQP